MKLFVSFLMLTALYGCVTLSDRVSEAPVRHPCGNVWNVCPGDNAFLDWLSAVLGGRN
ncbi:hypothetical protein [Burkholderia phage BCSR52]|uniref:Uncharacterized protein n=1 Tax=Burkholderia phage BCSR52 TaxID=2805748 RepID=A0A889IQA6_9CAUD|nr:hypothetical protein [Burkholderia phage BCSR52]